MSLPELQLAGRKAAYYMGNHVTAACTILAVDETARRAQIRMNGRELSVPLIDVDLCDGLTLDTALRMRRLVTDESDWFAYRNELLEAGNRTGHHKFLRCGTDCAFVTPPPRLPDTDTDINWRYMLRGQVYLDTFEIDPGAVAQPRKAFDLTSLKVGDQFLGCSGCFWQLAPGCACQAKCPDCGRPLSLCTVQEGVVTTPV